MTLKAQFLALTVVTSATLAINARNPQVVAHRGYWDCPGSAQNSITALVKADSIGCDAVELDVWITADDVTVVNHNADICDIVIETARHADLACCHLSNSEPLPTLEQFLDAAVPLSVDLVLEIKPHKDKVRELAAVKQAIALITAKGLTERTTYITFSPEALAALVELAGRPVYYLTASDPEWLATTGATGPDYNIAALRRHPEWLESFTRLGMPVNIWTVSSQDDLQWCIDQGADFLTTNNPELAIRLVEAPKP